MPGVVRTRVGYCGGDHADPTYHDIGDDSETIEIDFDPAKLSYTDLLEIFWTSHSPCMRAWSTQYKSAIFYANDEQKKAALASRDKFSEKLRGAKIQTEISALKKFYPAEDYHQKYVLRNSALMDEFHAIYPNERDFMNSTATARVNSYLSGHGSRADLKAELPSLGLSEEAGKALLNRVRE